MSSLHRNLDALIDVVVEQLVDEGPDGEYATEELIARVEAAYSVADIHALKRAAVRSRVEARDKKQSDLARSSLQARFGGEFAPPQGEFKLGEGKRIPKAKAKNQHWVIRLQMETEHISDVQSAHAATLSEYAAYAGYLQQPGVTTSIAYEQYRADRGDVNPDAQAV